MGGTSLVCTPCVLKISNGYVTGDRIISWKERLEEWGMGNMTEEKMISYIRNLTDEERKSFTTIDTMSWDEFQKRINHLSKIN